MRAWAGAAWSPVPSWWAAGPPFGLLLAEAPAEKEVERGGPLVGPSGEELNDGLAHAGIYRHHWDSANVISCRCPGSKYELMELRLRKENGRRVATGLEPWPHPAVCCRPRLDADLARTENVVTLGREATAALLPGNPAITKIRGAPKVAGKWKVLPALHPAHIVRQRRYRVLFHADLRRAVRYFTDRLEWVDPAMALQPTPEILEYFLFGSGGSPWWTYDVETTKNGPRESRLQCIGISRDAPGEPPGAGGWAINVPFLSIDGHTVFYDGASIDRIRTLFRRAFTDGRQWVGWNAGSFDRQIIERHLGVTPAPLLDFILVHHLVFPELRHGLSVPGSMYLDIGDWKHSDDGDDLQVTAESDHQRWVYCCRDTSANHRIVPPLWSEVTRWGFDKPASGFGGRTLLQVEHRMQEMCVGLYQIGVKVNEGRRAKMEEEYAVATEQARVECVTVAEDVGFLRQKTTGRKGSRVVHSEPFNPASAPQVASLLYETLGLEPHGYTEGGEPATGDEHLRAHLMGKIPDDARRVIRALRVFRKKAKILGTYLVKLRRKSDDPEKGMVDLDGRLRSTFSEHVTGVGRKASSDPNMMNVPDVVRDVFEPEEGHVYIGCDFDQIHWRIMAARWDLKAYLKAFKEGKDVHRETMMMMFGRAKVLAVDGQPTPPDTKGKGSYKRLRTIAKIGSYAGAYAAKVPTIHAALQEAEDEAGNFIFANVTAREADAIIRSWKRNLPELEKGWEHEINAWRRDGHLKEPISGRICQFADGFDLSALANWPILAGEAAIADDACLELLDEIPFHFAGENTGMVLHGHDALYFEVPESMAERVAKRVGRGMTREYPTIYPGMVFTASPDIGRTLREV